jgi:hypothetical protein
MTKARLGEIIMALCRLKLPNDSKKFLFRRTLEQRFERAKRETRSPRFAHRQAS